MSESPSEYIDRSVLRQRTDQSRQRQQHRHREVLQKMLDQCAKAADEGNTRTSFDARGVPQEVMTLLMQRQLSVKEESNSRDNEVTYTVSWE